MHRLEEERSLLRERRIALSDLFPSSSYHRYGRYGYLGHYTYSARRAYYILDGGETFQMTFKFQPFPAAIRRRRDKMDIRAFYRRAVLNLLIVTRSLHLRSHQDE